MDDEFNPLILVFSTNMISDVGIDFAGNAHIHYPPQAVILRLPCSSMVRPDFILHALKNGFDGVFIAADGTDCPYLPDCTDKTAKRVEEAQKLLKENGIEPERIRMAGICSVCAEAFANGVKNFYELLKKLGPVKYKKETGEKK